MGWWLALCEHAVLVLSLSVNLLLDAIPAFLCYLILPINPTSPIAHMSPHLLSNYTFTLDSGLLLCRILSRFPNSKRMFNAYAG